MAHQSLSSNTSRTSEATSSVLRLEINADKLFRDVNQQLSFPTIDNTPPLTLLAIDSPVNELADSSDSSPQADTAKMIDSDADCSHTVLVDTKAFNRQKELDERYGG